MKSTAILAFFAVALISCVRAADDRTARMLRKADEILRQVQVVSNTAVGYSGECPEANWALSVICASDEDAASRLIELSEHCQPAGFVSQETVTPTYNTVSTEIWRVLLPSDWAQKEASNDASIYFESSDESKGVYFISWRAEDAMSPTQRCRRDFEILKQMEGSDWMIIDQWQHDGDLTVAGIDCFDEKKTYRIVCQTMVRGAWATRVSFHDYACSDYAKSRAWFAPLIESFGFNEKG